MRIFMFKSETTTGLNAFAGDSKGEKLPSNHAPWLGTGVVNEDRKPPHNFARPEIEKAIEDRGFQLWRMKG